MKQTLKLLLTGLILAGTPALIKAQVPQKFNYQGIARDSKGNPMGKQTLGIKLSVLPTSDATTPEYEEVQTITTNEFGLYTLQIGNGQAVTGTMAEVKWETGNKYIRVSIDPQGGSNYVDAGTTQLLSVPYAIYADKAGLAKETAGGTRAGTVSTSAAGTGTVNYLTKFTAANTIYNSQVFDNGSNVGIGTTSPFAKLHINQNNASVLEHLRMQNQSAAGAGRFTMYSDGAVNYATFTKYGSTYAGSYAGLPTLYPFANLLAFGNNGVAANDGLGRFLISTAGNAGISLFKGGTSKLKFHADFTTENVGIGGNSAPVSRVHLNNTDGTSMDVRLTNNTSGHTANDGLTITENGTTASINNMENGDIIFATNNQEKMRLLANGQLLSGITGPLFNNWYRAAFHQPDPGSGSAIQLSTADAGIGSFDGIEISMGNGGAPRMYIINRELGGIGLYNGNSPASSMYINSDHKVGIGTESPTSLLHVNGTITSGDNATTQGTLTMLPSNGAAFFHVKNNNDNTLRISHGPVAGSDDLMTINSAGNVGIGTTTPSSKLEVNGDLKITDGTQGIGKVFTSDANGLASWVTPALTSSSGTLNYLPKFNSAGTTLINSQIQDNGTNLGINTSPSVSHRLFVYDQQQTSNGDGQHALFVYRTRNSANDGISYAQLGSNTASAGLNYWGDVYTFGLGGWSYNDYSRTGGVLGADVSGAYWGALGYRSSGTVNYGVYGSSAYFSGGGFLPSNEVAGIGGGFFGSMIGSVSKGKVIGQMNSGELFASYNIGDVYISGKQVEIVQSGEQRLPAYSVTSTVLTVYNKGKITLQNGSAYVAFDKNYSSLMADIPVVTVTAMGACNGLYIESIDKNGFTIRELNNGTSHVTVSWISVADRIDQSTENQVPAELLQANFEENLQKSLHDDSNKEQNGQGMWWDGATKQIRFGVTPASTYPARKTEGTEE